ncbi:pyridoxamine 5'-phosphate oxidase family protein [Sanguibacter antarcticus]|uniref:Pyridoxamine 5'-phosphate oxidase N-terminal domain-containing protein n=1 Tax=Sanguibacter antarcticus TaxID=372484 RepID=A0A2A9E4Z0_9MICO|nr:pyridoxamine 5'-phosphate oxidase family protein [Sanguibacter antarcticus]PFG33621.1 hypothetical protein ATL42_1500 [Sanguibacter antarcticus]
MVHSAPAHDPGRSGVSWGTFVREAPDLADQVRERFEAHSQHVLATLTIIGSPRVSGASVGWWRDELWIAAPPGSHKARDLRADARLALHSNPGDGTVGDARVGGLAVDLVGGDARDDLLAHSGLAASTDVFLVRLRTVRSTAPVVEHGPLETSRWRSGHGAHEH